MLIEGEKGTMRLKGDGRLFFRAFGTNEEEEIAFSYRGIDFDGGWVEALNSVSHRRNGTRLATVPARI